MFVWADSWDAAGNLLNFWDDPPAFTLTAADIAFVKAQGREVFLSLGEKQTCVRAAAVAGTLQHKPSKRVVTGTCAHPTGGGGGSAINGSAPPTFSSTLGAAVVATVRKLGFDGVDLDTEVLVGDVLNYTAHLQGVVDVIRAAGISVTMTPEMVRRQEFAGMVPVAWRRKDGMMHRLCVLRVRVQPDMYPDDPRMPPASDKNRWVPVMDAPRLGNVSFVQVHTA